MNEETKELLEELARCALHLEVASGESLENAVRRAPSLLRKAVDEIKDVLSENARFATENDALGARIRFYKKQVEWLTGEVDRVIGEYEEKLQDLREICDEKSA